MSVEVVEGAFEGAGDGFSDEPADDEAIKRNDEGVESRAEVASKRRRAACQIQTKERS